MKEDTEVFYAIKNFIEKDYCLERVNLVNDYLNTNNMLKRVYLALDSSSSFWLVFYALLSSRPTSLFSFNGSVCLWKNTNELNCFNKNKYFDNSAKNKYTTASIISLIDILFNTFVLLFNFKKVVKITRLINKRDIPLFVKLRASLLLFDYLGFRKVLSYSTKIFRIIVSTDGQPFAYALFALGQKSYCKVDYVAHAYYVNNPGRINVDNFFTLNNSLLESFLLKKSIINNKIVLKKNRKELKRIEKYSFLIALSKSFNRDYILRLIKNLDDLDLDINIIIRYHPTSMFSKETIKNKYENITFLYSSDQDEDFKRTNITIGGASNILIDSIISGNHTFYDKNLDSKTDCNISFVQLFPRFDIKNIEDSLRGISQDCFLSSELQKLIRD